LEFDLLKFVLKNLNMTFFMPPHQKVLKCWKDLQRQI